MRTKTATRKTTQTRRPVYIVRAKESPDSDRWLSIGAAWDFRDGEGFVVRIQSTPLQWDGSCILVPPLEKGDDEKK